jgi:hypothetical protein
MKRLLLELGSIGSRTLNVLTGGDADTSLSARVHIDGLRRIERVIDAIFVHLPRWLGGGPNHCRRAWEFDVTRARGQIARDDARNET